MIALPLLAALHEISLALRAEYEWGPDAAVFATRYGTRNTPDKIRRRILAGLHDRANGLLKSVMRMLSAS